MFSGLLDFFSDPQLVLISLLYAFSFGMLAWSLLVGMQEAAANYDEVYATEAARELENLFLFIPPQRIARIARVAALIAFLTFFVLFTNVGSLLGMIRGVVLGGIAAGLVLAVPRLLISFLRKHRLEKFNLQLVDALVSMSNALKAGFSIMQAFETIVKEYPNPIRQELNVFLQQNRVGVRFEDALDNLDERVGSQDLTLMVRSIETARLTGGNLTEVFEKIAETIRERIRIEGRISAMTAMGRLQGIVVGLMPLLLLFVLTALKPQMMRAFYTSPAGIGMLILVLVLELVGYLVIRKIVNIDI